MPVVSKYTEDTVPRADLVVIWVGKNDLLYGNVAPGDEATGAEKYTDLLVTVRQLRPDTPLLCLYPEEVIHASHPESRKLLVEWAGASAGFGADSAYARQKVVISAHESSAQNFKIVYVADC